MTKIFTFVISLYDFFDKLFECKLSKLITRDDYPVKMLTDLKENDIIVVIGFAKEGSRAVVQALKDYQQYISTGKVEENTFFFPTNNLSGVLPLSPRKKYKIISKGGFPSLIEVPVVITGE